MTITNTEREIIMADIYAQMRNIVRLVRAYQLEDYMDVTYGGIISTLEDIGKNGEL